MQQLTDSYLIAIAEQISFLSAFLGGFSATMLITLVVFNSSSRVVDWVVGAAALAASGFIIAVITSVMTIIILHPDSPSNISDPSAIAFARIFSTLGFSFGIISLTVGIGLSGWVRSRKSGIFTTIVAIISLALILFALIG